MIYHKLLQRQLALHAPGDASERAAWMRAFLMSVHQAYEANDADRALIERELDLASQELNARNVELSTKLLEREQARDELRRKTDQQGQLIARLSTTQGQLLQSQKMASIGQLAAGVAHEINNPIGFVGANLRTLKTCVDGLLRVCAAYEAQPTSTNELQAQFKAAMSRLKHEIDYDYLLADLPGLIDDCVDGVDRMGRIVKDLRDFSHSGPLEWQLADLHQGLDSTLNIVENEIRYVADVERCYGELPAVQCLASELNQVFMNLLVNAAHACKKGRRGRIRVTTGRCGAGAVFVEIADDGCGIPAEHLSRVFDPFFTTKPVGKGTGLGLSLSCAIVKKHGGTISVISEHERGASFRVVVPVVQHGSLAALQEAATTNL